MMFSNHHSKPRVYLALALAAALCFAFSFSPLASVTAQGSEVATAEKNDTFGVAEPGEDPYAPEEGGEEDGEPDGGEEPVQPGDDNGEDDTGNEDNADGGAPEDDETIEGPTDIDENEDDGSVAGSEDETDGPDEEEPVEGMEEEEEAFIPPEYNPQPENADEAYAMWLAAVRNGSQVMWEFELEKELVPEGMRQEYVLLDEESNWGYWTLYMDVMMMAAATTTVTSVAQINSAINAAQPGDDLTFEIAGTLNSAESIVINKNITLRFTAKSGQASIVTTAIHVRHFIISGGDVNLYFNNVSLNGNRIGGGMEIAAGANVYMQGAHMVSTYEFEGQEGGSSLFLYGKLEIADSLFDQGENFNFGGHVYVANGGQLKISGTKNAPVTFKCGVAPLNGGSIYVAAGGSLDATHMYVTSGTENATGSGSDCGGRASAGAGGAVYWEIAPNATGTQAIRNSVIEGSLCATNGAGLYIKIHSGATLDAFEDNRINNNASTGGSGGGLYLDNNGAIASFANNTFTNNFARYGSALYVTGSAKTKLQNTTIQNNMGTHSVYRVGSPLHGAGVYSESPDLTMDGITITGNVTKTIGTGHGAGMYIAAGKTTVSNGEISGNTSVGMGGAVYVAKDAAFYASNVNMKNNTAQYGGAVYAEEDTYVALQNGEIAGNTTTVGGGFALATFGQAQLTGVNINNHTADSKNGTVLVGRQGHVSMLSGVISDNTVTNTGSGNAVGNGAAVYVTANASFTMSGGTISNNRAVQGAAIYASEANSVTINGGTIEKNTATKLGGAIYLEAGNDLQINTDTAAVTIQGNTAPAGGAVYSYKDNTITVGESGGKAVTFNGNKSTAGNSGGGAVYMEKGTLTVNGGTFINNTAAGDGGVAYLYGATVQATFNGGTLGKSGEGNTAVGDGGAIFNSAGSLTITGNTIIGHNTAQGAGGGVSSSFGENLIAGAENGAQPYIHNNTARVAGGGVYVSDGSLGMRYTTLHKNEAPYGGGLYVAVGGMALRSGDSPFGTGSTVDALEDNTFTYNHATQDGGGLYIFINEGGESDSISGNLFDHNTAVNDGGGLYIRYYGVGNKVADNKVQYNEAGHNGGGVYVEGTMERYFAITSDEAVGNTAGGNGGGIYVHNTILRVYNDDRNTQDAVISNNSATNGGGIYASGYAKIIVDQGNIIDNTAEISGGGIYSNVYLADPSALGTLTLPYKDELVRVDSANISGNKAKKGNGGGIYIGQRGGLTLKGTKISGNGAINGGGVYIATFGMLVIDVDDGNGDQPAEISNNNADMHGGGLYVSNGTLTMNEATISKNVATGGNGGGAYVLLQADGADKGEAQRITYNTFFKNEANNGGGLYINIKENATSRVIGGNLFEKNAAETNGGGAWLSFSGNGKSVYFNKVFENTAYQGGGVYITGTSGTQNNMAFANDEIKGNIAEHAGGGIMVENSTLVLFDAQTNDEAGRKDADGNLIEYKMLNGDPITGYATIEENIVTDGDGGGIYLNNSTLLLQKGIIHKNTASANGGGIYANGGSLIKNYNPLQIAALTYELTITGNIAENGDGGGMYLVPMQDYKLTGLTVQSNEAPKGDGGGIYVAKAQLQYLHIENSVFGSPNMNDGESGLFNKAKANTYVPYLTTSKDASYIGYHGSNLGAITGQSPEGVTWAEVTYGSTDPLYYNNFDIAFHTAGSGEITVTYHANTGYFANNSIVYSQDASSSDPSNLTKVAAPTPVEHDTGMFIGWYSEPQTVATIFGAPQLEPNIGLTGTAGTWAYAVPVGATEDVDFYASWLFPPTVDSVYDNENVITVRSLENASSIELTIHYEDSDLALTGTQAPGNKGVWYVTLPGSYTLTPGLRMSATQTIQTPGSSSYEVTSKPGENYVLPTYRVYYHLNAPGEDAAETQRLERDWLPEDGTHYQSSADMGKPAKILYAPSNIQGRDGYDFIGWQEANSSTIYIQGGQVQELTVYDEDVHLYAQWTPFHTLVYNPNTNSEETDLALENLVPVDKEEPAGSVVEIDPWKQQTGEPLREGYRFMYWTGDRAGNDTTHYLDPGSLLTNAEPFTDGFATSIVLNRDRDLFAKWLPLYQVTYDLNYAGAPTPAVHGIVDPAYYEQDVDYFDVLPDIPEREGYTFTGWNYYQNAVQGANNWYDGGKSYLMDEPGITLYAQWSLASYPPVITKHSSGAVEPGDTYTYTITVFNRNLLAVDAVVTDVLPDELAFVSSDTEYTQNGQELRWEKTLDAREQWVIEIEVTLDDSYTGNYVHNTATAVFDGDNDRTSEFEDETPVIQPPGLEPVAPIVTKRSGETAIIAGDDFTYTLTVLNNSLTPVDAVVTDILPEGLTFIGSSDSHTQTGQSILWQKAMQPQEIWRIEVYVNLSANFDGDTIHNTVEVIFNNDTTLTSIDDDTTIVLPPGTTTLPPAIEKTSSVTSTIPGGSFAYTITVENPNALLSVQADVTDTLPAGLTLNGSNEEYALDGRTLTWSKRLAPGEIWAIEVDVTLDKTYTGTSIKNTAVVVFEEDEELAAEDENTIQVRPVRRPGSGGLNGNNSTGGSASAIAGTGDAGWMMWLRTALLAFTCLCLLLAALCVRRQRMHRKRYAWYYKGL